MTDTLLARMLCGMLTICGAVYALLLMLVVTIH
jgi:hypothetical protein